MPYLGKTPSQGVRSRYQFTPNAGTTDINSADANGNTLTFTDGNYVDVYLNGVMLKAGTDYNTTTANQVTLSSGTAASDVVDIIVYDTFSLFGGTLEGNVKVNNGTLNVTGATDLDSTLNVDGNATFGGTINTTGTSKLQFGDTGTYIHQSADGVLDLVSDTEIEINATTVDVNGQLSLIRADGESDNAYVATFKNEEATDDRSYGVLIHAGSTNTDRALTINDHDGSNALFYVHGNGRVGIGTTGALAPLHVVGQNGILIDEQGNGDSQLYFGGLSGTDRTYLSRSSNDFLIWNTSDGVIRFGNNNAECMRQQGSTLLVGSTQAIDTTLSGGTPALQVVGSGFGAIQSITRRDSGVYGPSLILAKSKNTSAGSYTAVVDNDSLGNIIFIGDDGTDLDTYGAMIGAEVNGTPGSNDMPTDLVFSVNSGSASATERMRLTFNQWDASELYVTAANSSESNANAWVRTKSKGYYWNGLNMESSDGNVGSIMGKYQSSSPEIKFFIGGTGPATGTDALIIDGSANVNVITGNLKISTSGKGIDFSATGQASGNTSELFDDYEEGTWTPAMTIGGSSSGITYASGNAGNYTKVGRLCVCNIRLNLSDKGSSSGDVKINLPFTNINEAVGSYQTLDYVANFSSLTNDNISLYAEQNSATALIFHRVTGATIQASVLADNSQFGVTFAFFTT